MDGNSRWDTVKAAAQTIQGEELTEELFASRLSTHFLPEPDLLICTGGEQRISDFLLWEMANTEFLFVDKFWPDFSIDDMERALVSYASRDRRFGKASPVSPPSQ